MKKIKWLQENWVIVLAWANIVLGIFLMVVGITGIIKVLPKLPEDVWWKIKAVLEMK